ncbi:MAG: glycosyltransferase family 4 protein [Candidatus Scalindua sp.]|jgi:glycosyltransferase involved in cell wall biosynthesis|nr:glycosyltransferase family 4 protein [Candidatus Scalindua sp.]
MNILEREENKTIDVIYFHTEGGAIGTETNELVVPSSNLIDFFLEVANQVDRSEIIFPRINMKRKVFFKNITHTCSLVEVPVQYDGNLFERISLVFLYPFFLLSSKRRHRHQRATHSVSIGYDFFGIIAAIVRVYVIKKSHTFVIRGNRPKTVATSSRSFFNKNFALFRIKIYDKVIRRMVKNKSADIWFQGQQKYEEFSNELPEECKHRLHLLNAVLRDFPTIKKVSKSTDLIFLGHINIEKGIIDLLESLAILKSQGIVITLRIVGSGADLELTKFKIEELNLTEQVILAGFAFSSEKVIKELSSAKLFVLPSYTEGLPRAMIESMAIGTPVLVTPVGGIPFVIKDNMNGFLVEPKKPDKLAKRIQEILGLIDKGKIDNILEAGKNEAQNFSFKKRAKIFLETSIGSYNN